MGHHGTFDLSQAVLVLLTGITWLSYGLWMVLRPDLHLIRRQKELDRLESASLDPSKHYKQYSRMLGLQELLNSADPVRRVRVQGLVITLAVIAVVVGLLGNKLYLFFS